MYTFSRLYIISLELLDLSLWQQSQTCGGVQCIILSPHILCIYFTDILCIYDWALGPFTVTVADVSTRILPNLMFYLSPVYYLIVWYIYYLIFKCFTLSHDTMKPDHLIFRSDRRNILSSGGSRLFCLPNLQRSHYEKKKISAGLISRLIIPGIFTWSSNILKCLLNCHLLFW